MVRVELSKCVVQAGALSEPGRWPPALRSSSNGHSSIVGRTEAIDTAELAIESFRRADRLHAIDAAVGLCAEQTRSFILERLSVLEAIIGVGQVRGGPRRHAATIGHITRRSRLLPAQQIAVVIRNAGADATSYLYRLADRWKAGWMWPSKLIRSFLMSVSFFQS